MIVNTSHPVVNYHSVPRDMSTDTQQYARTGFKKMERKKKER